MQYKYKLINKQWKRIKREKRNEEIVSGNKLISYHAENNTKMVNDHRR